MRHLLFLSLLTLCACGDDKNLGDSGSSGGPGDGDGDGDADGGPECTDDLECAAWEICEAEVCEDGDRNNAVDEAEAVSIAAELAMERYINNAGDMDYYTFTSAGGEFIFTFVDAHDEVGEGDPVPDTFLTLFDPDGNVVTTADDFPNGGSVNNMDSAMWAYLSQEGTYVLRVEDANPIKGEEAWGGRDFTYTLTVKNWNQATYGSSTFEDPIVFGESGLTLEENTLYAVGIILENPGDVDYIVLNFPYSNAGLYVDGIEDLTGSDANPKASILTMDGALLSVRDSVGPDGGVYYPNMTEGSVIVSVEDAAGGGGSNHWAVLIISAGDEGTARDTEIEANDSQAQATIIEMEEHLNANDRVYFSGTTQGAMNAAGDVDYFEMQVSGDATATTEEGDEVQYLVVCMNSAKWGSSITPDITVYDDAGNELGSGTGNASADPNNNIENIALDPGAAVYLAVTAGEDNAGSPDEWYMINTFIASFSVTSFEDGGYKCP
jgi:hypothetical protein